MGPGRPPIRWRSTEQVYISPFLTKQISSDSPSDINMQLSKILIICITSNALPFWGSQKFQPYTRQLKEARSKARLNFNQDQCYVLGGVIGSKLPYELRETALNYLVQNCVEVSQPAVPKRPKSRRHKAFTAHLRT